MAARFAGLALAAAIFATPLAADAHDHVARAGETLDQLATAYYGTVSRAMIIRAANGFLHPDDGRLLEGERVKIPEVTYHRASAGDTWETIADRYLGSPRRGRFLAEMNGAEETSALAEGQVVKVPYQLLYVLAPDETLKSVAKHYLGGAFSAAWLQGYNLFKKKKTLGRGDALLVPLVNVEFTEEAKARIKAAAGPDPTAEDKEFQVGAARAIAALREDYAKGRYVRVVAEAERLLGTGKLTVPQQVGVYKYLASAYVAFGDVEAAVAAFLEALVKQPDMELSPITTSPKILEVFRDAQRKAQAEVDRTKGK
jgi:ribosomal protein L15/phage tail protein X